MAAFLFNINNYRERRYYSDLFLVHPSSIYEDHELHNFFRFGNDSLNYFEDLFTPKLERETKRSHALPVRIQILICLRFLASGAMYSDIATQFGVHKSTVSRVVDDVVECFIDLKDEVIVFPQERADIVAVQRGFDFPNMIGAVDGTHIRIVRPHEEEHAYINRKLYPSLNVQACCDHMGE